MSASSPIQQLPLEVLHIIYAYLKPRDVTKMRLQCRVFATVGLHYLLRSYHLIFKKSSFKRLLEISRHPIVSQCVKAIYYEADALSDYHTMDEWEKNISGLDFPDVMEPAPSIHDSSEREQRLWMRRFKKGMQGPRWTSSKSQLRTAYDIYQGYLEDQADMRICHYNAQEIKDAMSRLSNLASLQMSMCFGMKCRSNYVKRAFSHAMQKPCGDDHQPNSCGVPQLQSLLLGIAKNDIQLQELHFGLVDWRIFQVREKIFAKFKKAVQSLSRLHMLISTTSSEDDPNDEDMYQVATVDCSLYLRKGRLRDLVTAASSLKHLEVDFDTNNPQSPAQLPDIVGKFTWSFLQSLQLSTISCTNPDLIAFYERHSGLLRNIGLDHIMLSEGAWQTTFRDIGRVLCLKEVAIAGYFYEDGLTKYYFGLPPRSSCYGDRRPLLRRVVERYLLNPKRDRVLPNLDDVFALEEDFTASDEDDEIEGSADSLLDSVFDIPDSEE